MTLSDEVANLAHRLGEEIRSIREELALRAHVIQPMTIMAVEDYTLLASDLGHIVIGGSSNGHTVRVHPETLPEDSRVDLLGISGSITLVAEGGMILTSAPGTELATRGPASAMSMYILGPEWAMVIGDLEET